MPTATEYTVIESDWKFIGENISKEVAKGWKVIGFSMAESHAFVLLERPTK